MRSLLCISLLGSLACSSPKELAPLSIPIPVTAPATTPTTSKAPESKLPASEPVTSLPKMKEGCVGGPYHLNMLLSKKTCPIEDKVPAAVAMDALTIKTVPSPLVVKSGESKTFEVVLVNNTKDTQPLEVSLRCSQQLDEIFLRAMQPGTALFADLKKQPESPGCAISWGCAKSERDARIGLTAGSEARWELTYTAVYMETHCDPGPATNKPLPPGKYELLLKLPISIVGGGNFEGRVPLTITK